MADPPLPSSFDGDEDFYEENTWQRVTRRLKEEPLIPVGCALTVWALVGASRSIRAGTQAKTNQMFRFRIYAQGFTLAVMGVGSYYYQADRKKRKVFEAKIAEQKAEERKQAWIRELEARDREDQAMMENKEAAKRTAKARAAKARAAGLESPALQGNELPQEKGSRGPGVLDAVKNLTEDS